MDNLFLITAIGVYFSWRNRLRNKAKSKLNPIISRLAAFIVGASITALGVTWFLEFSGLLTLVGPGISREHFAGVIGIIFGPIFALFGAFVTIASLVAPIQMLEKHASKKHEDIKLW
jgi:hypothetical protein